MASRSEEVQEWPERARADLEMARRGLQEPDPLSPEAAFHCQQAAEKALKALLSHHDVRVERTPNLPQLLRRLADLEPGIEEHLDAASTLTPYGVGARYPGSPNPAPEEARDALEQARSITRDVEERIG